MRNTKKIENKRLKKVRMRGRRIPGFYIVFTGWWHDRRGLVVMNEDEVSSPWLKQRKMYFDSYTADIYQMTGTMLKQLFVERESMNRQMHSLKEALEKANSFHLDTPVETVAEKRSAVRRKWEIASMQNQYDESAEQLIKIKLDIAECEHYMRQLLERMQKRVEAQMMLYMRGAHKISECEVILKDNEKSRELYDALTGGFSYCLEEIKRERGGCV